MLEKCWTWSHVLASTPPSCSLHHTPVSGPAPHTWIQLYAKAVWCSSAQTSQLGPTQSEKKKEKKSVGDGGEVTGVKLNGSCGLITHNPFVLKSHEDI